MRKSISKSLLLVAGVLASGVLSGGASADVVVPQGNVLTGTTFAVDDAGLAVFVNANTTSRVRWTAQNQTGSATTTTLSADPAYTSSDHYWTLNTADLVSGGAAIPRTAEFVQLDFTLSGGWVAGTRDDQIFRTTEGSTGFGSTTPSGQTDLPWDTTPGVAVADGSYSVIFELNGADAGTNWTSLRYDFFNESDANNAPHPNAGGKTYTLDAVTFADAITTATVPEPGSVAFLGLGALGLFVRRRR